jgi:hypothetical protein
MFKGKFVVLSLIAAALLSWQVMPASVDTVNSGVVDPCSSSASSDPGCWVICPLGDGAFLNNLIPAGGDATISVTVKDQTGAAIPGIPAADFWVIGWADALALCGGAGAINATAASDANGETTITGQLAAGGCDVGVAVVVQGTVILDPADWTSPLCLDIIPRSPDGDASLSVINVDFAQFTAHYEPIGNPYEACWDFNCDTFVNNVDFAVFGAHYQHFCN